MSPTMVGRRRKFWFSESLEWSLNQFLGIIVTRNFHFTNDTDRILTMETISITLTRIAQRRFTACLLVDTFIKNTVINYEVNKEYIWQNTKESRK